ncbi:MAG: copper homeostasis protein CutC [Bacteroidia bacterium]
MSKLEIACFDLESALIAQQGGADRVELCHDVTWGGVTPSYGTVETARKLIRIQLFVMIRPRIGNYVYSDPEFEQIKSDIRRFSEMKVDGLVFGILKSDGSVDIERNKELVRSAGDLPCSFHRASDEMIDPLSSLEALVSCGYKTVLTSGQQKTALEGIELISQLKQKAAGRIGIMPGGGVRSSNIEKIKAALGVEYYHSSAIVSGQLADLNEVKALKSFL